MSDEVGDSSTPARETEQRETVQAAAAATEVAKQKADSESGIR